MPYTDLDALVAAIAGAPILCVGDLVLDHFVHGTAERLSREAPVVTLSQHGVDAMLGSVGNVARNVTALGGKAILAAVIGDDDVGLEAARLLADSDLEEVEAIVAPGRATAKKTRFVASSQQVLCVDQDPGQPLDPIAEGRLIEAAVSAVGHVKAVILSDYGRGSLTANVVQAVLREAEAKGVASVVDPRGRDFRRYEGARVLKPNTQELATETDMAITTDADVERALRKAMARLDTVEHILVTRGAMGMALISRANEEVQFFRAQPRVVYDVSGAGDTTIAALALGLAATGDLLRAIDFAQRAAGIAVTKVGTATVRGQEVLADARARSAAGAPVMSLEAVRETAARWRADGLRVGLTNGCFDVLHMGHLVGLNAARAECDRLIVGVNADASVRQLKGQGRPVNPAGDRVALVAALAPVDAAVIFEELTAEALVEAVCPHVYVKGGDYTPESLPEAAAVAQVGGRIVITPLVEGRSTTKTLEKITSGQAG